MLKCFFLSAALLLVFSCNKNDGREEVWIYTSLYKDTIADMAPQLDKAFPHLKINWYQAGSEDIAAKVNTEMIAGEPKADLLISSERFWYQELSDNGKLYSFRPAQFNQFYDDLKNPLGTFHIACIPIMVLAYNSEVVSEAEAPKSFKHLTDPKYKGRLSGGSPLASGTSFTTVLALQHKYGWDYFRDLKTNGFLFDGGNSAVIRRIQTKERPIGWVLLENVLRFQNEDKRLKIIYPEDGVVTQFNTLAIPKKEQSRANVVKVAEWFFTLEGQKVLTKSYMHSPVKGFPPPPGAPELTKLKEKAFPWTPEIIRSFTDNRYELKEKFAEIMYR